MGASGFPDPGAVVLRFAALGHALFVARAVARNNIEELLPIDIGVLVVARCFVECQFVVGNGQSQEFRLRNGNVDEFLAEFVVAEALDLPGH